MNELKLLEQAMKDTGEEHFSEELDTLKEIAMGKDHEKIEDNDLFPSKSYYLDVSLIRVRIKERKLTLKTIHEQVGVAYRTVTRWIAGEEFPRTENLIRLAEVLEMEPHELVIKASFSGFDPVKDELRLVQRRMEKMLNLILDDEKTPKDEKLDALIKAHNALVKAQNSR